MPPFNNDFEMEAQAQAQAELELEQEQQQVKSRPFSSNGINQIGPNYNEGYTSAFMKGISDLPAATWQGIKGLSSFFTDPHLPTVEGTARTVGPMAAGVAGGATLGSLGAGWGSLFGPVGTAVGGLAGSALGFAGGMTGFGMTTDALADGGLRPASEYGKDFAYNSSQGLAGDLAFKGAKAAYGKASGIGSSFTQEGVNRNVGQYLNDKVGPDGLQRIDSALAEGQTVGEAPSFMDNRSLGELLGSDTLKSEQRALARQGSESLGRAFERNRLRNTQDLNYLDNLEQSPMTMEDVQSTIQEGIDNRMSASQRGITNAEQGVQDSLAALPEPIDLATGGQMVREGLQDSRNTMKKASSGMFEAAGNGIVDPKPAAEAANQVLPDYFREVGGQPSPEIQKLVGDLQRPGEPILMQDGTPLLDANGQPYVKEPVYTIQDLQAMRSQAQKIARGGDKKAAAVASHISEALDQVAANAVEAGTVTPEQFASLQKGIDSWKEQGAIFDSAASPSKKVLALGNYSTFKVPDSAVLDQYWRKGKGAREAMQNYKQAFGATDEALDPIYRRAADSFRDVAVKADGTVDSRLARKWLNDHAEALKEAPDLERILSNVNERQSFLNEKFGELKRTQADVENSAVKYILQGDPQQSIAKMLSGAGMVKNTMKTVQYVKANMPEALPGLRRGIIEHLKNKSFTPNMMNGIEEAISSGKPFDGTVHGGVFAKEIYKIRPALERSGLFTKSQLDGFETLYNNKRSQLSVENAKMPGGSDTAANLSVLGTLGRVARNSFLGKLPGGMYLRAIEPIIKAIPGTRFLDTLEAALLDPKLARDLMQKATAKNVTKSVETIFKEEINKAFGNGTKMDALKAGAAIALPKSPFGDTVRQEQRKTFPRQQQITARKTFPSKDELLRPAVNSAQKKTAFNVNEYLENQSAETRARVAAESSGNINAISNKGAQGLSQIMPSTGKWIAEARGKGEVYTPLRANMSETEKVESIKQNIEFGNWYFKWLKERYNGNDTLARAAYNAGQERIDKAIERAGTSTDANKILSKLPPGVAKETIPYVERIALNLARRG